MIRSFVPILIALSMALTTGCISTGGFPMIGGGSAGSGVSYLVLDTHSDHILNATNHTGRRPIASLTKIATAKVVLDWAAATNTPMSTVATVPPSAGMIGGSNPIGLGPGDRITLRDAMSSSMMASDNLAAETLAAFVGNDLLRRSGRGGDPVAEFVSQMNALAARKGMSNTRFVNVHGMEGPSGGGSSSAEDLARLCLYAIEDPSFTFYTSLTSRRVSYDRQGQQQSFTVKNTNSMVGNQRIDGIKTGSSPAAGECVIITADRPNTVKDLGDGRKYVKPHRLLVIVLGSGNRFGEATGLLNQGWQAYDAWLNAGSPQVPVDKILKTY
ncbi:MAG: serine hydrolase [Verrucomicrobia bacterium]|nr:serine hydrolase [Verrucomicrobiota bacterium]